MIRNDAVLNEELDPRLMIDRLQREIQQLKDELALATGEQKTDALTDDDMSRYDTSVTVSRLINPLVIYLVSQSKFF